jgi:hypothetical protein
MLRIKRLNQPIRYFDFQMLYRLVRQFSSQILNYSKLTHTIPNLPLPPTKIAFITPKHKHWIPTLDKDIQMDILIWMGP